MTISRPWQRFARCAFLGATAPLVLASAAYAQTAPATREYRIPSGPLTAVLNQFGREAGVLLSFSTDQTGPLQSQGLQGSYSVPAALQALLTDTGLEAAAQPGGGYVVRRTDPMSLVGVIRPVGFRHIQAGLVGQDFGVIRPGRFRHKQATWFSA